MAFKSVWFQLVRQLPRIRTYSTGINKFLAHSLISTGAVQPRIHAAVCLERLPLITPDAPEWEKKFEDMHLEVYNKSAKVYPKGFLSDAPARAAQEPDVRSWQPFPRITEADKKNDRTSLMRKLDRRLYLLVKSSAGRWQFPQVQNGDGETILQVP